MSITPQAFHHHLKQLSSANKFLIAYSGGVDSHVLLHLCAHLKNSPHGSQQSFSAVYIDHGISVHAKKWGEHCQNICYALDIPLTIIVVDGRAKAGQSPEASARTARYHALGQLLQVNECLLTAQHLDDQAETILLQLLRGSGVKGLSSMPRIKSFAQGTLCRPILDYKKTAILEYARQHQLSLIDDESNEDQNLDRNYLRHSVFPLLSVRWPAVQESFAKSAEILAESQLLLETMAKQDIKSLLPINSQGQVQSDRLYLDATQAIWEACQKDQTAINSHQSLARLYNVLRYWIQLNQRPLPSKKILEQIVHSVLLSRVDADPIVCWRRDEIYGEIRKYRNIIYLLSSPVESQNFIDKQSYLLTLNQSVKIHQYTIILSDKIPLNVYAYDKKQLLSQPISIRFRQGGERYRRRSHDHSHSLKHWFQEQAIPPWERNTIPLIYWGEELLQIGHMIIYQEFTKVLNDHSLREENKALLLILSTISKNNEN